MNSLAESLCDKNKSGKLIDWKGYKMDSLPLGESYLRQGNGSKSERVKNCADTLFFTPEPGGGKKLTGGYFCKVPLCPMCAFRRSRKIFGQVSKIMDYIKQREDMNFRYIFLTLTMRNVTGEELSGAIDDLVKGIHKLTHRQAFMSLSKGWFRALEITHNWDADTYHPHLHMVIAVDEKYITKKENYVTHMVWKDEWRKCMGVDYDPWVHVQPVRKTKNEKDGGIDEWKAIAEITKYTTKSNDYIVSWKNRGGFEKEYERRYKKKIKIKSKEQCEEMTDAVVAVLDKAMHKRRLVAFGGELKKIHKLLNLDDPENGDLIDTEINEFDDSEIQEELKNVILRYNWHIGLGDYFLVREQ